MRSSFLIGNFLPGYNTVFKYNRQDWGSQAISHSPEMLQKQFTQRSTQYEARNHGYGLGLQIGIASAILFIVLAFNIPVSGESEFVIEEVQQELVVMEEIKQTQQEAKPPPPPRPTLPISVPDDELIEDIELDLDISLDLDEELVVNTPPPPAQEEEEGEPELFVVVENPPQIIGGIASLNSALTYPRVALQSGVEGNVIIQVIVTAEGNPESPQVLRSASPLLNQAAIDAVMAQKFVPGKQRGRSVKTQITIPVRFKLKN